MPSVLDVAQAVYDELGWVDSWRLQKLTYYAEAWHLAWFGKRLVDEDFQAWVDGPVSPDLYRENKHREARTSTELAKANASVLTTEQWSTVKSVTQFYGKWTKQDLIDKTHGELPWLEARGELDVHEYSSQTISQETMMRFYRQQEASGSPVPVRPVEAVNTWAGEDLQSGFAHNVQRWAEAIELLADR